MSPEEFVEQVWNVERVLIRLPKRKNKMQLKPYPYQKRLSGTKRRDDLLFNRIQPCIGKVTAVIVDADGGEVPRNYTLQKIRTWYDVEKLDQMFENAALERLRRQLGEEIAKLQENDSVRVKEIISERRKAATLRSELELHSAVVKYARNIAIKYENSLRLALLHFVSEQQIPQAIKKIDDLLLFSKLRECVQVIDGSS